jgi:mono/diheme cytochrome c family protein
MSSKTAVLATVAVLILLGTYQTVRATDDGQPIGPAMIMEYTTNCGDCHVPLRPELLPSAGWKSIFTHLDDHFGQAVQLTETDRDGLLNYLATYSADRSFTKTARKIMESMGDETVERVTDVPYIRKKHDDIDSAVFERPSIERRSNCIACHTRAVEGIFKDDSVKIPE